MKLGGTLVAALILIGVLVFAFPPAYASAATKNHECFGAIVNSNTANATCTIDTKYDLIAVAVQVQDATDAGFTSVKVATLTDNHSNLFGMRAQVQHLVGGNCDVISCYDSEIWSATALGTFPYTDILTITLDHALTGGSEGFIEAYDVTGADNTTVATGGEFCESSCGGSPIANVPSMTFDSSKPFFILTGVFDDCSLGGSGVACTAGSSAFTIGEYPTNPESASEWSVTATSPTTAPMHVASAWYDVAVVFGPLSFATETAVTKCLYTQIQCWWYPMLFYGVFAGSFLVVGRAGSADPRGLTYLLLAALTFCSLIQVQMNMTNIMLPVILSITGIAYAVRGR